jgi:hypothetical protein
MVLSGMGDGQAWLRRVTCIASVRLGACGETSHLAPTSMPPGGGTAGLGRAGGAGGEVGP